MVNTAPIPVGDKLPPVATSSCISGWPLETSHISAGYPKMVVAGSIAALGERLPRAEFR